MLSEAVRKRLLGHLKEMGLDPNYIAREGATEEGYARFIFNEEGKKEGRIFVEWTDEQKAYIEDKVDFRMWFFESFRPVEFFDEGKASVYPLEVIAERWKKYTGCEVEIVTATPFTGIHPAPGNPVELPVIIRFKAIEAE